MTDVLGEKTVMDPELTDTLAALKLEIFRTINCVKIGQINSFDAEKKTVQARILFKRVLPDNTITDYPILVDCPVFTLQGGGGALQFPISAGDQCLILFSDRNIDAWFSTGSANAPFNARCHDIADGFALVGVNAINSPLQDYDDNVNLIIPDGKKFVLSGNAQMDAFGTKLLALKDDVDNIMSYLATLVTAFNAHVHTSAAPGNPTSIPTVPFVTTPPTMVGTTKLKGD